MSVVAGFSLIDGVLLGSDCRVTVERPGRDAIHVDCAQKVIPISDHSAIGFVGDLQLTSHLLDQLRTSLPSKRRTDPVSLMAWIPRLFRHHYQRKAAHTLPRTQVGFMVASVMRDRPNVVARRAIAELVRRIAFDPSIVRNFLPSVLVEALRTPAELEHIPIPGTARGLLYEMHAPGFEPRRFPALQFSALGSGSGARGSLDHYSDAIAGYVPGSAHIEELWFREAIRRYVEDHSIASVGGMYPVYKIDGNGIKPLEVSAEIPIGGPKIGLAYRGGRWFQANLATRKVIRLLLPWEIQAADLQQTGVFEDFDEAWRDFT